MKERPNFIKFDENAKRVLAENEQKIEAIHKKNGTKREIYTRPKK